MKNISLNIPKGILEIENFNKIKLDWYAYIMLGKDSVGKKEKDYLEKDLWDLEVHYLQPLKNFLSELISP